MFREWRIIFLFAMMKIEGQIRDDVTTNMNAAPLMD